MALPRRRPARCDDPSVVRGVEVAGIVRRGDGRGRQLGFPTANLAAVPPALADGVYAGRAFVDRSAAPRPALVVVGASPSFAGVARHVEAHLLDFAGDLYGRRLRIALETRVGDLRAYASCDALVAAIRRHAAAARDALARRPPPVPIEQRRSKGETTWS